MSEIVVLKQYIYPLNPTNDIPLEVFSILFCISANDIEFYADPPTFRSDSNTATLRFTSDDTFSDTGILMAYVLGKYFYF